MPVALAMLLAGVRSKSVFQCAEDILLPMGEYFQVQDDFLDCYGDPKVIGKIGRDIEDNKCSWLVVQALRRCTPEQRKILEANILSVLLEILISIFNFRTTMEETMQTMLRW
jgi:farnesyl diphosphate synthase